MSSSHERSGASERSERVIEGVVVSNPDRVYFGAGDDASGPTLTKADLVDYYLAVRPWLEPHIVGRPVMLLRCPEGTQGPCFFQRHPSAATARNIGHATLEGSRGATDVLVFDSYRSVVAAAAIGALELHIWGVRVDRPRRPDRMVFDLDPGEAVGFGTVKEAAIELAEALEEAGLTSFVMTTGGAGLHLVVPLEPAHEFAEVRDHARAWARHFTRERPDRYTDHASKAVRRDRIYIDVLRNGHGSTAICPWSTRARSVATVATPVDWEDLDHDFGPTDLTVTTALARPSDPWVGYFDTVQRITARTWAAIARSH
jgi:bifunctional non-homologous end joining protein LigD